MMLRPIEKNRTCHGTAASLVWNLRLLLINVMESWFVGWERSVLNCEGKGDSHRIRIDSYLFRKRDASFCKCKGEMPNKCIWMGWDLAPVVTKPPAGNDWDRRNSRVLFKYWTNILYNINVDHTSYDVFAVHVSVECKQGM